VRDKPSSTPFFNFTALNGEHCELEFKQVTLDEITYIDNLLMPIKSYQVSQAFQQLSDKITAQSRIILSHNGMPDLAALHTLNTQQLYFLTTSMGALKLDTHSVKHTGNGDCYLGKLTGSVNDDSFISTFIDALPNCEIKPNIVELLWQKLLINIAINPLSAVAGVKNGALAAPKFASEVFGLVNEAVFIAAKEGVNIKLSSALDSAYRVMRATAENYSSMNRIWLIINTLKLKVSAALLLKKELNITIQLLLITSIYRLSRGLNVGMINFYIHKALFM
jgi:2-dehydropantoate 2-reductase